MGLEVLLFGAFFVLGALMILFSLAFSMLNKYTVIENPLVTYFKAHPTRVQIVFHLMMIVFPFIFGIGMLSRIGTMDSNQFLEVIFFTFVMWPSFMYLGHRAFESFSKDLGISTKKERDPIIMAKLKVLTWVLSILATIVGFIIEVTDHASFWGIMKWAIFIAVVIPIRKQFTIISGEELQERKIDSRIQ